MDELNQTQKLMLEILFIKNNPNFYTEMLKEMPKPITPFLDYLKS